MLNFLKKLQYDTAPLRSYAVYFLMAKCTLGVGICYYLFLIWPNYPFDWAMISVALSLSLDNSTKFAVDRIISNVLGCVIGLLLFPIPVPHITLLAIGIILVIGIATLLKFSDMIRQSLAAFVIVMIREENSQQWFVPFHRVLTVMAGCIIALVLTMAVGVLTSKFFRNAVLNDGSWKDQ